MFDTDVSGFASSMKLAIACGAAFLFAAPFSAPGSFAQEAPAAEAENSADVEIAPRAIAVPAPTLARRHPSKPIYLNDGKLDIPQWAKDAGHNGSAIYTATVGPDGKLVSLVLKQSSNSQAIDEAVRQHAEAMYYAAGTNAAGEPIEGTIDVYMAYARFDSGSPGGGMVDYTCADFIREYDWFKSVHPGDRPMFWPENAFTSLTNVALLTGGQQPSIEERRANRRQSKKEWERLITACRRKPQTLLLDHIQERESYRDLVESF
ncbi:MAG: TonB family protein [Erythrobacter sp.]|uniref:energy transducer TonB n=1 Tax=Erythrobacter sp. TaxID=1042 RepID=UPI003C71984B